MSEHHDDVPHLEADETVPPRPEEEIADIARAEPQTGSVPVVADQATGQATDRGSAPGAR